MFCLPVAPLVFSVFLFEFSTLSPRFRAGKKNLYAHCLDLLTHENCDLQPFASPTSSPHTQATTLSSVGSLEHDDALPARSDDTVSCVNSTCLDTHHADDRICEIPNSFSWQSCFSSGKASRKLPLKIQMLCRSVPASHLYHLAPLLFLDNPMPSFPGASQAQTH